MAPDVKQTLLRKDEIIFRAWWVGVRVDLLWNLISNYVCVINSFKSLQRIFCNTTFRPIL